MNRTTTLAISALAAAAALFSGAASAQAAPAASAPAGKTRAEVIAETKAALRNGEIRDSHEWAMYLPHPQPAARQVPVKLATGQ